MDKERIRMIQLCLQDPMFAPDMLGRVSLTAKVLAIWVRAMDAYHRTAEEVRPKRAALEMAERECSEAVAALNAKKEALRTVVDQSAELKRGR